MGVIYFALRSLVVQNDPGTSCQKKAGVSLNQIWEGKKKIWKSYTGAKI